MEDGCFSKEVEEKTVGRGEYGLSHPKQKINTYIL